MTSLSFTLVLTALAAAAVHSVAHLVKSTSLARTITKTMPLTLLAAAAVASGGAALLVAALLLSAFGDAALSRDGDNWFIAGLGAFLLAHIGYVVLFAGLAVRFLPLIPQASVLLAVLVVAVLLLRAMWPRLGEMRLPVLAYVGAIVAMAWCAALLPTQLWPASAGALAFIASDCVLARELFLERSSYFSKLFVWWSYFLGQLLISVTLMQQAGLQHLISS